MFWFLAVYSFVTVKLWVKLSTVFTRFVARALIFFNQTHYRALIQAVTGACYFRSKIMHKNYLWRQIFHDINPFSMSIYSRQTQIIHIHIFTQIILFIFTQIIHIHIFLFPIVLYHWKISFYIGRVFKHRPLFIFMFCSHGRLFKQALNQDWAVKRVYAVVMTLETAPVTIYLSSNHQ